MRIIFNISYATRWGENLWLVSNIDNQSHKMRWNDGNIWSCELDVDSTFLYHYFFKSHEGNRVEQHEHRLDFLHGDIDEITVVDTWQDEVFERVFDTQPFHTFFQRQRLPKASHIKKQRVNLRVFAPMLTPSQSLAIVGSTKQLGHWEPHDALLLDDADFPYWTIALKPEEPVEYKFIVLDKATHDLIEWEKGNNRDLGAYGPHGHTIVVSGLVFQNPLPRWRFAGTAVPLFSLRSQSDMGVGDFADIPKLVDWACRTKQRVIQLLPVNDTTSFSASRDSHPYNPISAFALHPIFIRPSKVGSLSDRRQLADFTRRAMHLNSQNTIHHAAVLQLKEEYMRMLYQEHGKQLVKSCEFKRFLKENDWLRPYAAYCILRRHNVTDDTTQWGAYSKYEEEKISKLLNARQEDASFIYFYQFHLHRQLLEAAAYAHSHGVALKGDLPIGMSPNSVDVWQHPELFDTERQAGSPPDYFSKHGQVWGFPLYRWKVMEHDGFAWWKNRLRHIAQYFDLYRLDHILGYFRMWSIPRGETRGELGKYIPNLQEVSQSIKENVWLESGSFYLKALTSATAMLPCGEDLGVRLAGLPRVMRRLGILTIEMQRMPKGDCEFGETSQFPYLSVCTTSNHDMSVMRAWWKEDAAKTQRYYGQVLRQAGEAPADATAETCEAILQMNLNSPSMLAIMPLQDWLAIDERLRNPHPESEQVNFPSRAQAHWDFRFHLSLEALVAASSFNKRVALLVSSSNR